MRCQRCGFEIEPGQTFCSMCGTEQSKALRDNSNKKKINSILWVIKVTSKHHLKMYGNLGLLILAFVGIYFLCKESPVIVPIYCLGALLFLYIFAQCLIPYKNPNASKSKKYKFAVRICFILVILLFFLALVGDTSLVDLVK